jgi:hypothetical protein
VTFGGDSVRSALCRARVAAAPFHGEESSLSDQDPQERDAAREEARRKLMGRAMVIGFLALVAVYALFTFLGRR